MSRGSARVRRFRRIARTGYAMNGLIHLVIGGLAIGLVFGDDSGSAVGQSGVFGALAATFIGRLILWAAVVGLGTLGAWQIVRAVDIDLPEFTRRWGQRIVEAAKGVAYLALACTALIFALGGKSSSSQTVRDLSAHLSDTAFGTVVLTAIGLAFLGTGAGFIAIGIRRGFRKIVRIPAGRWGVVILTVGATGYIAKGIAFVLVGLVSVGSTLAGRPKASFGLNGAFNVLGALPYGTAFLTVVSVGLIVYGAFLVARARLAIL